MADLLALYWTVSGPVDVHYGREWSLFDWRDRCAEAAKAGFKGIGLWHADIAHQLETRTLAEIKQIFDDAGLEYLEVEFLADFFAPAGGPARAQSDALRRRLFEAAAVFGAHHIKVGNIPGTPCELPRLIDEFAALCADAAQHTDAKIATSSCHSTSTSTRSTRRSNWSAGAAAANGGLAIDTWHMGKLGIAPDELRRIPLEQLVWVELSDGQYADMDDPIDETINHRRLPGEGEFDIPGYVAACPAARLHRPVGRRGVVGGAAQPADRREVQAGIRDDLGAARRRRRVRRESMAELDNDRLVWMFTQMLRIREFEERVKRTFEDHPGVIRGHTHLADGAEASIVGSLATLESGDQLLATYRCHGYPIVLGTDSKAIMAEIYGRTDGLCGGYGGSMHLADPDRGFLGTCGHRRPGHPPRDGRGLRRPDPRAGPARRRSSCRSSATAPRSRAPSTSR